MHFVALHEALVLLFDSGRSSGEGSDVVVQIPAQVLIKHRGHEVELFVIVFLHEEAGKKIDMVQENQLYVLCVL